MVSKNFIRCRCAESLMKFVVALGNSSMLSCTFDITFESCGL